MIDLHLTRESMLEDIGAVPEDLGVSVSDLADPELRSAPRAHLLLRAHQLDGFFDQLTAAFRARFPRVSFERLQRDLIVLVRKAIRNAFNWGNHGDTTKWLTVEVVFTDRGAVVAVSDEGTGFDVPMILGQFLSDQRYYTHGGKGFAFFDKTSSLVSYANGGSTILLRFLADPEPGRPLQPAAREAYGPAADARRMGAFLASEVPYFRDSGVPIESCRVYATSRTNEGADELTYVVRQKDPRHAAAQTTVLTGRLLPEREAEADVAVAGQLYRARTGKGSLRVPKALGAFRDPPLSLFLLDPSRSLRKVAASLRLAPLMKLLITLALGLAGFHEGTVSAETEMGLSDTLEKHRSARNRIEGKLPVDRAARVGRCFTRLEERAEPLRSYQPVPIHGSLTWNAIVRVERKWELYRFERSRLSHPGLDVGAFLADMLRLYVLRGKGNAAYYWRGREAFLQFYFGAAPASWSQHVDWFVASALLERLDRMLRKDEQSWEPKLDAHLVQIEQALG